MAEQDEINEIREIITWYQNIQPDYLNVNELMHKRQKLAAASYFFATSVGEASKAWGESVAMCEIKKNKLRVEFGSNQKADYQARANNGDLFTTEKRAESLHWAMKEELAAIKEVLASMNQHIAYLRDELAFQRYVS